MSRSITLMRSCLLLSSCTLLPRIKSSYEYISPGSRSGNWRQPKTYSGRSSLRSRSVWGIKQTGAQTGLTERRTGLPASDQLGLASDERMRGVAIAGWRVHLHMRGGQSSSAPGFGSTSSQYLSNYRKREDTDNTLVLGTSLGEVLVGCTADPTALARRFRESHRLARCH